MPRNRSRSSAAFDALREALSAANLRAIMGVVDTGRALLAKVGAPDGQPPVNSDGRDLLVSVLDAFTDHPLVARLHIPANILWRKPRTGETVTVVVPIGANAPGGPVAFHGDAGDAGAVPPWLGAASGIYTDGKVRVESRDDDVTVETVAGKKVLLGAAATKSVNRQGDHVSCGSLLVAFAPGPPATLSLTYTPPFGPVQTVNGAGGTLNLVGVTEAGSNKVKAED